MVPGAGVEPARPKPRDFLTIDSFRCCIYSKRICGLDFPFTLSHKKHHDLGRSRQVSTLSSVTQLTDTVEKSTSMSPCSNTYRSRRRAKA